MLKKFEPHGTKIRRPPRHRVTGGSSVLAITRNEMKSRLFSTLRVLRHENPLVIPILNKGCYKGVLMSSFVGTPALRRTSTNPAYATRSPAEETYKRCKESYCCELGERRSGEKYSCWYESLTHSIAYPIPNLFPTGR
jgi:hypothetical protein